MTKAKPTEHEIENAIISTEEFKKNTTEWSGTLFFKDLNVDKLNDGMDETISKHKKLPKVAQSHAVYGIVKEEMEKKTLCGLQNMAL